MLKPPDVQTLTAALIDQHEEFLIDLIAEELKGITVQIHAQRVYSNTRPINVRIDRGDVELAKRLGGGNTSAGLRVALRLVAEAMGLEQPRHPPMWAGFMGGQTDD